MKRASILAILFLALGVSACNAATNLLPTAAPPTAAPTETSAPTATPAPTATAKPALTSSSSNSANPLDALKNLVGGWGGVKSFRANFTTTKGTTTTTGSLDVVLPDRYHFVAKTTEVVVIGNVWYIKVGKNWIKSQAQQGLDFSFVDWKKLMAGLGAASNVKLVGADQINGEPVVVYQYTITVTSPVAYTSTTKAWIAASDHFPRKTDTTSSLGTHTVATFSNFNDPTIVINPPIP